MMNHDPVAFEAAAREGVPRLRPSIRARVSPMSTSAPLVSGAGAFRAGRSDLQLRRRRREVLSDSRTMTGGGAAGVATLGAARVEVAQNRTSWPRPRPRPLSCRSCRISTRCARCSSRWLLFGSQSRSARDSMTGSGGCGDRRASGRVRR
jgi:hypothetical protein